MSVIPFLEILFQSAPPKEAPAAISSFVDFAGIKANGYYALHQWVASYPNKINVLLMYSFALLVAIIIKNIGRYFGEYFMTPYEQSIVNQIREDIFTHLTRLGLPFYTSRKKGDIIGLLVSDVQVIEEAVIRTVMNLIREPLTMLTFLFAMLLISWKMTLFTFLVLPVTAFFLNFISKKLKRRAQLGQEALGRLTSIVDEFISGIRVVKAFQKENYEVQRYQKQNDEYSRQSIAFRRRVELASPITEVISIVIICVILLYGGNLILNGNGDLKANEFIGFIALFSQFLLPIRNISSGISKINKALVSFARVQELLQVEPKIKEQSHPLSLASFEKEIRFENVSFRYKDDWVLQNINLTIPKGKTVALVGQSGGGKSTLVDLIPRFYDPVEGRITIDGVDIKSLKLFDLRKEMGYVAQEGILFHDTILQNIAYGENTPDRAAVQKASEIANAAEFIEKLPHSYDTMIGERGTMLSGGQRQRISIARAVYRNPPILILDEATSNLDTESEKFVQDALEKIMQHRTSIVIAHRLSTILNADKIVVIDKGKIVEEGTHNELIAAGGVYKKLYEIQFEG